MSDVLDYCHHCNKQTPQVSERVSGGWNHKCKVCGNVTDQDFDDDDYGDGSQDDPHRKHCWLCHGDGWGLRGEDWENDDPVNEADGEIERCPCCGGSGKAEDECFW